MRDFSEFNSNLNEINKRSGMKIFEKQLKSLEGADIKIDEIPYRGIILNHLNDMSESKEDRGLNVQLDTPVKQGSYVIYNEEVYLVVSDIDNHHYYKTVTLRKCNQTVNLKGWDKPIPCFVTNDSYGNKLLLDSDILSMSDEKCKITIQDNQFTRKILKNTRFMFEHSEHGIFKVFSIDVVYQKGLITLICKKDTYKEGIDDLEHNVAGQVDMVEDTMPKDDLVIYGSETIKLGSIEEYTIQSSVTIAWSIDNSSVCTMTEQGKNYCKLKALRRDEVCILTAKINSTIVYQKMITTTR